MFRDIVSFFHCHDLPSVRQDSVEQKIPILQPPPSRLQPKAVSQKLLEHKMRVLRESTQTNTRLQCAVEIVSRTHPPTIQARKLLLRKAVRREGTVADKCTSTSLLVKRTTRTGLLGGS